MARIHLINPNTSVATTDMMVAIARAVAPADILIEGLTAQRGVPLIVEPVSLATAATAVMELSNALTGDGVIVAAFGDPGADALSATLSMPVIGIGEASILTASHGNRRFSIVTTTPMLEASIRQRVAKLGSTGALASIRSTSADPHALTANPAALETALRTLAARCIAEDGAEAIIVGGGPLSLAARAIARHLPVPLIEPIPCAVAQIVARLNGRQAS